MNQRSISWLLLIIIATVSDRSAAADEIPDPIKPIVFRIEVKARKPHIFEPWKKFSADSSSGSGVLIEGNRILTNAHVVEHAAELEIIPDNSDQKWPAEVVYFSKKMDLAIIRPLTSSQTAGLQPLPYGPERLAIGDEVKVYGYPVGGSRMSVTRGVVSRHDFQFVPPFTTGLRTQIDAAINPGNSGGPVVSDGRLVGIASSRLEKSDNIGYMIPVDEIKLFLEDCEDGTFDGPRFMWDTTATVENPALREKLKLPPEMGAFRILEVRSLAQDYPLQVDDIIVGVAGHQLDLNCDVHIDDQLTVSHHYLHPRSIEDGKITLSVWRDGNAVDVAVPLAPVIPDLMPLLDGGYPDYAILGPLPFTSVSRELGGVISMNDDYQMRLLRDADPLITRFSDVRRTEDEELVIIAAMPWFHPLLKGYSKPMFRSVRDVNGVEIQNLQQLIELIRDSDDEYLEINLYGRSAEPLTFRRTEFLSATEDVLEDNNIRNQFSDRMRRVWEAEDNSR